MERYYDMDGSPADLATMTKWYGEKDKERIIAKTDVGDQQVSTVFLVINHQFGDGPPLIFETMVFGKDRDEEGCWRYATKEEAEAGHERVVAALREGRMP